MGLLDALYPKHELGNIYVAVEANPDLHSAGIKISEDYAEPKVFFAHLCFAFEDLGWVVGGTGILTPGLRPMMHKVLRDISGMMWLAIKRDLAIGRSPYHVGTQVQSALSGRLQFEYQSRLFRRHEGYLADRSRPRPTGLDYPADGPILHLTAFALFNHLLMKTLGSFQPADVEFKRIACGVEMLMEGYEQQGAFRSLPYLLVEHVGKLPSTVASTILDAPSERIDAAADEVELTEDAVELLLADTLLMSPSPDQATEGPAIEPDDLSSVPRPTPERVAEIVSEELGVAAAAVLSSQDLVADFGMDEVARYGIVLDLMLEYDMDIPDDEHTQLTSVARIVQYVAERMVGSGGPT